MRPNQDDIIEIIDRKMKSKDLSECCKYFECSECLFFENKPNTILQGNERCYNLDTNEELLACAFLFTMPEDIRSQFENMEVK